MKKSKKRVKNRAGKLVPVSELTANDLIVNAAVANVAAKTLREIARVARRAKLRPDELRYRVGELLEGKTASSKKFHTPLGWGDRGRRARCPAEPPPPVGVHSA